MMAVNQVTTKRKLKSYKNCPRPILNVVPKNCTKITFADLVPGENYERKVIIGKINHLYQIGKRLTGYIRKILVTDALDDCENNEKKLAIFLLDKFAQDSESCEVGGFIVVANFIVENLTNQKTSDLPVQILVKNEESQIWFGRKVNKKVKVNSKTSIQQNKQNESDEEEPHAISTHHYEYTKLRDLLETDVKGPYYNIYGIVDKCDLKITQGKKTQILDLLLTDQTETGFSCAVFAGAGELFPDVYPGDIVRIHRMQVYKFRGKFKGRCPNAKFMLVFSKNNEGDKPRTVAKTFTFTPEDISRFRELFEWNKTKNDPKLICEVEKYDFVNIICQVIGVYVARNTEAVILKIWDGTKTEIFPGVHYGMKEEKLDERLFAVARSYYVILSVYGLHAAVAAEIQPGQYIEVRDAHLYSTADNPDNFKLCVHAGNKEGRGITVLNETDERVVLLKERLEGVISSILEYGTQTDDILSQNNSIFLNCDISIFTSTQKTVNEETPDQNEPNNEDLEVPPEEQVAQNGEDITILNEPLPRENTNQENMVVSVIDVAIKPGQSTQEFGLGMPREKSTASDAERPSVASESDPICNLTPLQTRYFFHDPQQLPNQMADSIFPTYMNATQEEWWSSVPTVSVTDGHSDIKPNSLAEIVQHAVPYKFRVIAAVFCFKPNTTSIQKFIHLCCPKCLYITNDACPSFEPFEITDGLTYYLCPVCSDNVADQEQRPILEYTFILSFSLHDGSGPPFIDTYLWKENAVKFFKGITPEEALRDSATADSILHMLWSICPNCRPFNSSNNENSSVYPILDCCILSYRSGSDNKYQMFDTILV